MEDQDSSLSHSDGLSLSHDGEPSFHQSHFHTSTPKKSSTSTTTATPHLLPSESESDANNDDDDEQFRLRESDTESLDGDHQRQLPSVGVTASQVTGARARLTRRTLAKITTPLTSTSTSTPHNNNQDNQHHQQTPSTIKPSSRLMQRDSSLQSSASTSLSKEKERGPWERERGWAPTPSTGSSTLVDRDEPLWGEDRKRRDSSKGKAKAKGRRHPTLIQEEEMADEEDGGEVPAPDPHQPQPEREVREEDEDLPSSSSGTGRRPLLRKPRKRDGVQSYIDSHSHSHQTPLRRRQQLSSLTPSPPPTTLRKEAPLVPATPVAPGGYPLNPQTKISEKIHEAFRLIRTPTDTDRAIQALLGRSPNSNSPNNRSGGVTGVGVGEPRTPHPGPGWYDFDKSRDAGFGANASPSPSAGKEKLGIGRGSDEGGGTVSGARRTSKGKERERKPEKVHWDEAQEEEREAGPAQPKGQPQPQSSRERELLRNALTRLKESEEKEHSRGVLTLSAGRPRRVEQQQHMDSRWENERSAIAFAMKGSSSEGEEEEEDRRDGGGQVPMHSTPARSSRSRGQLSQSRLPHSPAPAPPNSNPLSNSKSVTITTSRLSSSTISRPNFSSSNRPLPSAPSPPSSPPPQNLRPRTPYRPHFPSPPTSPSLPSNSDYGTTPVSSPEKRPVVSGRSRVSQRDGGAGGRLFESERDMLGSGERMGMAREMESERKEKPTIPNTSPAKSKPSPSRRKSTTPISSPPRALHSSISSAQTLPPPPPKPELEPEPHRNHQPDSGEELDARLRDLTSDMLGGVRELLLETKLRSSQVRLSGGVDERGLPKNGVEGPGERVRRLKKESEGRMELLKGEMRELEEEGRGVLSTRDSVESQLYSAKKEERTLAIRVEELRRSMEEIAERVGGQVSSIVQETLDADARKRSNRFLWFVVIQVILLWIMIRFANIRAQSAFYDDPFYPSLFQHYHHHHARFNVLPETVLLFQPSTSRIPGRLSLLRQVGKGFEDAMAKVGSLVYLDDFGAATTGLGMGRGGRIPY
ncbi:hypothetical protein T439DRAFT_380085 [Meredithblackwellia eburnea MCA 4105]